MRRLLANIMGQAIVLFAQLVTAVRADWQGCEPVPKQRIYFANHTTNADLPVIWSVLPPALRRQTRPVAAADYWLKTRLRAFMGPEVFRAVLIDRRREHQSEDPIDKIIQAIDEGASIIIFPEGGRNMTEDPLLPLKAGLYNIARKRPDVDLIPTWINNINNVMPKGEVIPVPLGCSVIFGAPIYVGTDESKDSFLARAASSMTDLIPKRSGR